jgi:hypothetical protein
MIGPKDQNFILFLRTRILHALRKAIGRLKTIHKNICHCMNTWRKNPHKLYMYSCFSLKWAAIVSQRSLHRSPIQKTSKHFCRLGTNHPWVKDIHVCTREGDCPSPRGDISKRIKIHWKILNFFSTTSRAKSIKLGTNYSSVKKIQVCSNKGPGPLQRGNNHRNVKMRWESFKKLLLQKWNHKS